MEIHRVTSRDGTPIAAYRSGAGPPLLLVHGTTADHSRWAPISPRFEQHFTVYAMDRRGRGESGDAPEYELRREAEDVAAVVDGIGEPVFVLGHSHGALCSLEAALLTENVSRLILYEPPVPPIAPPTPPAVLDEAQRLIDRGELEAALELFMREIVKMPEHELEAYRRLPAWNVRIQLVPTAAREEGIARTYRFNAERFARLEVPTMLLLGGDSPPWARQASELVDSALPDSRIVVLPGQQHIAMDMDPELFVGAVLEFLLDARGDR